MTSLFACGRFSKSRGLSASVSFLPSFPFPFPLFNSLHSSPCNSLLLNCTETLATQASDQMKMSLCDKFSRHALRVVSNTACRRPNFWSKLASFQNRFCLMCNARALSDCTLIIIEPTVDYGFQEIREFPRVLTI